MAEMPEDDLEPLITECPSCQTRFRVSDVQLQRARGRVRCGACLTVFHGTSHLVLASLQDEGDEEQARQALDALLDELAGDSQPSDQQPPRKADAQPAPPPRKRAGPGPRPQRPTPLFGGFEDSSEQDNRAEPEPHPALTFEVVDDAAEPPAADVPGAADGPEEAGDTAVARRPDTPGQTTRQALAPVRLDQPERNRSASAAAKSEATPHVPDAAPEPTASVVFGEPRHRRPLVWLGIAAGLLLLAVQILWYQFDDWAKQDPWRGIYVPICGVLGCELPVQRDTAQLTTRNLLVRTHPREPRSLLVNAVIANHAEFAQPFPVLELQFTTVRGNLVASRRFDPDEYLAGDAHGMTLMPPRTPVQIELAIDDPGPDAVNYRLVFR
jgi:predicted Zn finger-like uncharacterized protein